MKWIKRILILLLIVGVGFGIYWVKNYYDSWTKLKAQEESEVLLEKVRTVCKLITVEGQFSEILDYRDYWGYNWSFFRKKALIRVKAKVSVGYDLSNLELDSDPEKKIIIINNLPDPSILSIDHDLDYYDISEGVFNSFSVEDYNQLQRKSKELIERKARSSDLFLTAEQQASELLDMLDLIVSSAGWKLNYEPRRSTPPPILDSLLN